MDKLKDQYFQPLMLKKLAKEIDSMEPGFSAKSFIEAVAVQMLGTYTALKKPPPVFLAELFSRLLDTASYGTREHRAPFQKDLAAILVAREDGISNRALAKAVGVSVSTISGWRKDPNFIGWVADLRDHPMLLRSWEEKYRDDLTSM